VAYVSFHFGNLFSFLLFGHGEDSLTRFAIVVRDGHEAKTSDGMAVSIHAVRVCPHVPVVCVAAACLLLWCL
jgi:hypothetical protein